MLRELFILLVLTLTISVLSNAQQQIIPINAESAFEILNSSQGVSFITVSDFKNFKEKHIKGSIHVNYSELDTLHKYLPASDSILIIHTLAYNINRDRLSRLFYSQGYETVYQLTGNLDNSKLVYEFGNVLEVDERFFRTKKLHIEEYIGGKWVSLDTLIYPSLSIFEEYIGQYRPFIEPDTIVDRYTYQGVYLQQLDYSISSPAEFDDKLWFGFEYYRGEGSNGYGGIGFFDPDDSSFGVLRHPALVGCSTQEIKVIDDRLYIATYGHHELSNSICNGIVVVDPIEVSFSSVLPKQDEHMTWHKDEGYSSVGVIYNNSIDRILSSDDFYPSSLLREWHKDTTRALRSTGLYRYMKSEYQREVQTRSNAVSNPTIYFDSTYTINFPVSNIRHFKRNARGVYLGSKSPYGKIPDSAFLIYTPITFDIYGVNLYLTLVNNITSGYREVFQIYPGWQHKSYNEIFFSELTIEALSAHAEYPENDRPIPIFDSITYRIKLGILDK